MTVQAGEHPRKPCSPRKPCRLAGPGQGLFTTLVLSLMIVLAACGGSPSDSEPATAPVSSEPPSGLEVRQAWVQLMPGTGVAYLTILNHDPTATDRLLRVESDVAQDVEIHETREDNGVLRMTAHPDGLEVPPGQSLELRPGGIHLMMIEPSAAIDSGDVDLRLFFERAGMIEVQAELRLLGHEPMAHDHHQHEAEEPRP